MIRIVREENAKPSRPGVRAYMLLKEENVLFQFESEPKMSSILMTAAKIFESNLWESKYKDVIGVLQEDG